MSDDRNQQSDVQNKSIDVNKLPRGAISMRGLPMGRNARLPSIRTPRDLTLVGAPKRTFVPNIPVRRDKKPSVTENSTEKTAGTSRSSLSSSLPKSSPNSKAHHQRGRSRKEYVQLPGSVFGQGVKASPKTSVKFENDMKPLVKPVASKSSRSSSSIPNAESVRVKKEERTQSYLSSDGDDDYDYDPDDNDEDYEPPVCLPLKIDPDLKIKIDKGSKAGWNQEFIKHCCKTEADNFPEDVGDLFFNSSGAFEDQLMFFEFPDTILRPLQNLELDDNSQRNTMPGPSSENSNIQSSTSETPSWTQAVEGYIGKLQLMRSGKTRLVIRDYVLDDLEMYESSPVFQQLTSISGNQSNLDMTVLGQVKHRVRFMADVETLANIKIRVNSVHPTVVLF